MTKPGPKTLRDVRVNDISREAEDILSFELVDPDGGDLTPFAAGAHIDVHIDDGLVRQYSLCNDPDERHRYVIAVLNEPDGRGGSLALHETVSEGDLLTISEPRNHFRLADDAARRAFLRTLRAVVDPRGQAVSASNRLHLAAEVPTLIVWGDADPIIPVDHAYAAHASIPGSRLEIFEGVGHYPHCEAPERFIEILSDFVETTVPARITVAAHHGLRQTGS